jgi:hypothetical protein
MKVLRRSINGGFILASIFIPRIAQSAARPHFYAGCFYDTAAHPESMLVKHLVAPERLSRRLNSQSIGSELGPRAREIVQSRRDFLDRGSVSLTETKGNAVVLGVQRAQHETVTIKIDGTPDEYVTVISITVSLDVVTDQAAFRNTNRFESIFSTMIVVNQAIQERQLPSDSALSGHYARVFSEAVNSVLDSSGVFGDGRDRANAVFQIKNMVLPDPLTPELDQLVVSALRADGENSAESRRSELRKLSREFQHIYNLMLLNSLQKAGATHITLLPPSSPWSEGRVLRQLQQRLGVGSEILSEPDPNRMNGYEIRAGVTATNTISHAGNSIGRTLQSNVSLASRIVRNKDGALTHVPLGINAVNDKVAIGVGYDTFSEIAGLSRSATRDVVMRAYRKGAAEVATKIVPLILKVASEIN